MSYFTVLLTFIVPPILILLILVPKDLWRWFLYRETKVDWSAYIVLLIHIVIALIYTSPWDNYLVAKGVWWYDLELVTGFTIGWVPIEEYTFFVLQTMLTGLWTLFLLRNFTVISSPHKYNPRLRWLATVGLIIIWLGSLVALLLGVMPTRYLALILIWALPAVLLQVVFGADILWAQRKSLLLAVSLPTIYLWIVDALAISTGTWTIDPAQTVGWKLAVLPFEEMLFFLMTNLIIAFGMTLMTSPVSKKRARAWLEQVRSYPKSGEIIWKASLFTWLAVLIATPIGLWLAGEHVFPILVTIGVLAQWMVTTVALSQRWTLPRIVKVLSIVVFLTWGAELLGSRTGFPFGYYTYTAALEPKLGGVPLLIPLAWLMMLPPAWGVAESILIQSRQFLGRWYVWCFAFLSGMAFTAWDLYLDPQMTKHDLWFWQDEGGYFGIPWINFLGWWLVSSTITLILRPAELPRKRLILIYSLIWIFQAVGLGVFWGQPGPALVGFLVMGTFVTLAVRKEWSSWRSFYGRWLALPLDQSPSR